LLSRRDLWKEISAEIEDEKEKEQEKEKRGDGKYRDRSYGIMKSCDENNGRSLVQMNNKCEMEGTKIVSSSKINKLISIN
jgi:hypothetical protein